MATLDTSMYGTLKPAEFENPLIAQGRLMQLMAAKDQQAMGALKRQKAERDLAREGRLAQLAQTTPPEEMPSALRRAGFYDEAAKIEKAAIDNQKAQADVGKINAERVKIIAAGVRDLATQFDDNEVGYQAYVEAVRKTYGDESANRMAPTAVAGWQGKAIATADKMYDLQKPIMKEINDGQRTVFVDMNPATNPAVRELAIQMNMTPAQIAQDQRALQTLAEQQRHNRVSEGISYGNLSLSRQRLDLERDKEQRPEYGDLKEVQAADGSRVLIQQDKRSGSWVDANTKQPVTGFGPQPRELTPEASGRLTMIRQANNDVETVKGILFDARGQLNRSTIAAMQVPGGGLGEKARTAVSALENAASAKYRLETGAAGNKDEEASIRRRFIPTVMDTAESAKFKLDRLQEFMKMSIDQMRESGMVSDATLQRAKGNQGRPALGSFGGSGNRPPLDSFAR